MQIESLHLAQIDDVVRLSLRAWAPVFASIEASMDPEVYRAFYPNGWEVSQETAVRDVCTADDANVWVAIDEGAVAGFVSVNLHAVDKLGEIYMIAVDPDQQRKGTASALTGFAVDWMREQGMTVAMVETGGDPGHAPARAVYEKSGFGLWPVARYFRTL